MVAEEEGSEEEEEEEEEEGVESRDRERDDDDDHGANIEDVRADEVFDAIEEIRKLVEGGLVVDMEVAELDEKRERSWKRRCSREARQRWRC
jgi:hypothetical protein